MPVKLQNIFLCGNEGCGYALTTFQPSMRRFSLEKLTPVF